MVLFGHAGLGLFLVSSLSSIPSVSRMFKPAPVKPLLLGTLLPDLIDKPLYYISSYSTGLSGAAVGLISGTRTFAHTLFFLVILFLIARMRGSAAIQAAALGVATHHFFDIGFSMFSKLARSNHLWEGWFWPVFGTQFAIQKTENLLGHLSSLLSRPDVWIGEPLGLLCLILFFRRRKVGQNPSPVSVFRFPKR